MGQRASGGGKHLGKELVDRWSMDYGPESLRASPSACRGGKGKVPQQQPQAYQSPSAVGPDISSIRRRGRRRFSLAGYPRYSLKGPSSPRVSSADEIYFPSIVSRWIPTPVILFIQAHSLQVEADDQRQRKAFADRVTVCISAKMVTTKRMYNW